MDAYETFSTNGYTVEILADDDPMSPRDADNLGVLFAPHTRYTLGDEGYLDLSEFKRAADYFYNRAQTRDAFNRMFTLYVKTYHGATVVLPVSLLDHSGLSMSVGQASEWDSGQIGWIFDTTETRKMAGVPAEQVEEQLRGEVAEYDRHLSGDTWGFRILDSRGEVIEALWGILGLEYAQEEARLEAKRLPERAGADDVARQLERLREERAKVAAKLADLDVAISVLEGWTA